MRRIDVCDTSPFRPRHFRPKLLSVGVAALTLAAASTAFAAATIISVDFRGRTSEGTNAPVAALAPTEVAGVVPVGNWNSIDDSYGTDLATFKSEWNGTTKPLVDSTGAVTPVTLTFAADDSWNNDVDLSTNVTANAKMMKGVIKMGNGKTNEVAKFTFSNVPAGQYDLYIYSDSNNTNVAVKFSDNGGKQTFYVITPHQFYDTSSFIQATNTSVAGPFDEGNYVKMTNLAPDAAGDIGFSATYLSGGDGLGIAGLQLIKGESGPPTTALTDGLTAYWSFDGNLYDSIKDFHGTARGAAPVEFVDGQTGFGKALKLIGTNYVEITGGPLNGLDNANGSLSIAGWFTVGTFDKSWQALIAKGENSNYRVARRSAENTIAYAGGTGEGVDDSPNVNDGKWHHFAAVTDADVKEFGTALYIDGKRYSVATNKPALTASTKRLLIGENPEALNRQWNGQIDDIGIWKRALSAAEVSALYNGGQGMPLSSVSGVNPPAATLLDFPFDEGQGTVTTDTVNGLPGIFGQALDAAHAPVIDPNSPSGATNDLAVSFNVGNPTNMVALVVDDRVSPVLAFATNAPFTMETWVNIDPGDTRQYEGLGSYGFSYKMGLNNQELIFTLYGIVDIASGIKPTPGEWHHVASVWKPGTGVEFFLDGTSVTNVAEKRVFRAFRNNYLTIGAEQTGTTNFAVAFQGSMDRFRIHKAALTAAQLDSVASSNKPPLSSTVVAYNFNEGGQPFRNAASANRPAISSQPPTWPTWTGNTPSGLAGDFALQFARGQHIEVPNPNNAVLLDTNNPSFTMQAWVNFQTPTNRMVFYYNNGPGGALSFSVFTNRTIFVTTLGLQDQSSNAKIPDDGNWHHIAVVHENGKEFRFYVDGALADTQAYTKSVIFTRTNQVFYIGSEPTFGLQYVGMLDRLKVTKSILAPNQLDFPAGGVPPSVVSVGAVGNLVGVVFDRPVSPATAINLANYTVAGATVTNATLASPNYVLLGVSAVPSGAFSVTVNSVTGTGGDVMKAPATVEAAATPGGTIPNGLTAYWSFDGHLVDSVDGFDGVARGAVPVAFVDGPTAAFGKSLKLVGTNYVEIPGSSNKLQFANGSLSIAGWFKVDAFDKSWQALIAKGESADPGNYRVARRSDGVLPGDTTIAYAGGTGEGPADTPPVNDGKWHQFVAITDASHAKWGTALYIDGVIHSINTNRAVLLAGTKNLLIGENPEALNRQWNGEIDDIGLWNRVLAPEEIALLYNNGQGTPLSALPGVATPIPAVRPYTIGLNFGADEPNGAKLGTLQPSDVAGALPQANWNNLSGQNGTNVNNIVADTNFETPVSTPVTVSWTSNGTWASTGSRGETNNFLTGADLALTIGYLDTGNATTTSVTVTNIPAALTSTGYDVYVYGIGGVGGRGGAYRILDAATKAVLKDYVRVVGNTNSTRFIEAPTNPASTNYAAGNYIVFTNVMASAITVEATTAQGYGFGSTPRAPLNAIQLVALGAVEGSMVEIARTATGVTITFQGTLQSADEITGPWTDVTGTSPMAITPTGTAKFYRSKQ